MPIKFRKPTIEDADLYFNWANDPLVRENSFEQKTISYDDHVRWFKQKLDSPDCYFYLFENQNKPIGQVRIERKSENVIGISIDKDSRGKGFGPIMLEMSCKHFLELYPNQIIYAYIKSANEASQKIFRKAGFTNNLELIINNVPSIKLSKTN
ncbi:MAG: GNAT family N-acetyltransferase [Bacteroidia bacterium]